MESTQGEYEDTEQDGNESHHNAAPILFKRDFPYVHCCRMCAQLFYVILLGFTEVNDHVQNTQSSCQQDDES